MSLTSLSIICGLVFAGTTALVTAGRFLYDRKLRKGDVANSEDTKRRQIDIDERKSLIEERSLLAKEREKWAQENENLLKGYKAVFAEMRQEFDRVKKALLECEDKHILSIRQNEELRTLVNSLTVEVGILKEKDGT